MALFERTTLVEGHEVTLQIHEDSEVSPLVDGDDIKIEANPQTKMRIALAARRLWQEALKELPFGVYFCAPTTEDRRKLYAAAGWRPHPRRGEGYMWFKLLRRPAARGNK